MKKLILAVLCAACVTVVFGQETEAGSFTIQDNTLVRYRGDGGAVVIPPGITVIGEGAFYDCSSLTSVSIPSSVTSIEDYAFTNCGRLISVVIPSGIMAIGERVFSNCSSLVSVNIPSSVTKDYISMRTWKIIYIHEFELKLT